MHECVFSDLLQHEHGVKTLDIAKRLIDYGYHPPTIYFPLVVPGAIMIEPTETECKDDIDLFIEVVKQVVQEAGENPRTSPPGPGAQQAQASRRDPGRPPSLPLRLGDGHRVLSSRPGATTGPSMTCSSAWSPNALAGERGDPFLLTEHPGVFTLGRRGGREHLMVSARFPGQRRGSR